jgi:Flp pilus assembly protein TadG
MLKKAAALALLTLAACDTGIEPSIRSEGEQFPLRATWSAAAAPVGSAALRANLTLKEYLGQHIDATLAITGGTPNVAYQWRIFRGDCTTTTPAPNNTAPTGLLLFSTTQAYPDIVAVPGGTGSLTRTIVGTLDSLTAYSVRFRVAVTSTNWNGTNPIACGNLQRS